MKLKIFNNQGMTLPELILAIAMLIAFSGIAVMVTSYTARFFQPLNVKVSDENNESKKELTDTLNVHLEINKAFDSIIEFFSEPGIDQTFISERKCTYPLELSSEWKIPTIDTNLIPRSYKICIKPTTLSESTYSELTKKNNPGKPGIYILYAYPDSGVSVKNTPVRRIFCRPKPFCKK